MSLASIRRGVPLAARAFSSTAAARTPGPKPIDDSTSALDCEHQATTRPSEPLASSSRQLSAAVGNEDLQSASEELGSNGTARYRLAGAVCSIHRPPTTPFPADMCPQTSSTTPRSARLTSRPLTTPALRAQRRPSPTFSTTPLPRARSPSSVTCSTVSSRTSQVCFRACPVFLPAVASTLVSHNCPKVDSAIE